MEGGQQHAKTIPGRHLHIFPPSPRLICSIFPEVIRIPTSRHLLLLQSTQSGRSLVPAERIKHIWCVYFKRESLCPWLDRLVVGCRVVPSPSPPKTPIHRRRWDTRGTRWTAKTARATRALERIPSLTTSPRSRISLVIRLPRCRSWRVSGDEESVVLKSKMG